LRLLGKRQRQKQKQRQQQKRNTEILAFDFAQARMTTIVGFARMTTFVEWCVEQNKAATICGGRGSAEVVDAL
jgi:hypothetical protein